MKHEFDEHEAIHITGDSSESTRFFEKMMKDLSIAERIPPGSTIEIVSNNPGAQASDRLAALRQHAIESIEVGDQTVYILAVPAKDHAAD